ncbi:MAG: hypothetical protein F4Y70_07165 [Chloroflexi bacterium]|nr:hypothetical protein [Chloroflexota bacterium]MXX52059.1 hypothetical protein [Chloroflexota bacterium]MXX83231.1 hypothetical protein [Chloroflexota bacterium]MYA93944.1 hypothetical protein [Chloroflexota bacterium]MYC56386.1 hypothetical protein [Chloroflexota bacterium]
MTTLLDPTNEAQPAQRQALPRPQSLAGKRVGLLDISKPRGDVFLDQLETKLGALGVATLRYQKPTFARVAPAELRGRIISECDLVIEALAD